MPCQKSISRISRAPSRRRATSPFRYLICPHRLNKLCIVRRDILVLILDNGERLIESAAILDYLQEFAGSGASIASSGEERSAFSV